MGRPEGREGKDMARSTTRRATAAEVLKLLKDDPVTVYKRLRLPVESAQLSMPQDKKGPRIKVSLRPGTKLRVPSRLVFTLDGRRIQVPLETAEDYQVYTLR